MQNSFNFFYSFQNRKDGAALTCGVGELLLSDLLQLEDLLQSLGDLGPTDAYLLALPDLEWKEKKDL